MMSKGLGWKTAVVIGALAALGVAGASQRSALQDWAWQQTGEVELPGQVRGLIQLGTDLLRPRLALAPDVPIDHAGVRPYGINTFLEQEVEPEKREEQLRLISEAGFSWIRQEFPWYDIEIHGKNDFEDRRFEPHRSAWDKYDNIVELAEQYDIEIIARLSAPPSWTRAEGDALGAFAPPDNVQDYADFASAVAERYAGRVSYFQLWNEPNIYPEWGEQAVDPEGYTALLCAGYEAIKAANPDAVVLAGALAPTAAITPRDMSDLLFLERMYAAGAGECFDVMSVQGYGLWSGPTDQRMRSYVVNYARNQYIRDIMVAHGDASKAIWISEMNWNATPPDSGIYPNYGQVTLAQQAAWAPLAYQRAAQDWPWIGVVNFWFFKRAADYERGESWYYFRMAEPDFTLMPVYDSMADYIASASPTLYPGYHQEDHWGIDYDEGWHWREDPDAVLGGVMQADSDGATLRFSYAGASATLVTADAPDDLELRFQIDGGATQTAQPRRDGTIELAGRLGDGPHTVRVLGGSSTWALDGIVVAERPPGWLWLLLPLLFAAGALYVYVSENGNLWKPRRPQ